MKVHVTPEGRMTRINKALDPATAEGEYIGLTLIEPEAADGAGRRAAGDVRARPPALLRGRLPGVADRGGSVGVAPIGEVEWVEVDDHGDLERAREVACRC